MSTHQITHITLGFDFTSGSMDAARNALELAEALGATVRVVTALPDGVSASVLRDIRRAHRKVSTKEGIAIALQQIEDFARMEFERFSYMNVKLEFDVAAQSVMRLIHDNADMMRSQLIVVGDTDARSTFKQVGTETLRLVRHSMQPVWVNKRGSEFPPARILVPVDLSEASRHALAFACNIAKSFGSHLSVLHVAESGNPGDKEAPYALNDFLKSTNFSDIESTDSKVVWGTAHREIVRSAREEDYDLMCIGSLGRSGIREVLIGGTSERILRALPCSMVLVKPDSFSLRKS